MKPLLNLTIERSWLDMIASGEKREEYRSMRNRQVARVWSRAIDRGRLPPDALAIFRAGYSMRSPALAVEVAGMDLRGAKEIKHPEWGETRGELRFVIALGTVRVASSYADVKAWIEGLPPAKKEMENKQ